MPKIQMMKTGDLTPYFFNPRHNDGAVDMVAQSIADFGFKNPIIVDKDRVIIAGHTRLKAAEKLGLSEVPVIVAEDLTDDRARAFRLVDNRTAEIAEWDFEKLQDEIEKIDLDLSDFDFDFAELQGNDQTEIEEDEPPEIDEESEPIAKIGDVWKLGNHHLICGDSTDAETVEKLMDGEKADLYLTDPPYNVDYEGEAGKIQNDNMTDEDFSYFLLSAFSSADKVMKKGAAFYIWHADSEGLTFRGACMKSGWKVRQCLIWVKNSLVLGRQDYQWKHEPCLYGWKDGSAHNWYSDRSQTTILDFDRPIRNNIHPTMKPIALFAYLIGNSTKKGDVVFDGFGGSGTTLIACEQMARKCRMIELDPRYCDAIIKRWENLTGLTAELIHQE